MKTNFLKIGVLAGTIWLMAFLAPIPVSAQAQETPTPPPDICQLLGGRSDRNFAGRPGNLYAVVGAKAHLIYMAGELSVRSSLFQGKVIEWRPDFVQLQTDPIQGTDGQPLEGITAEKFCWIGPRDTLMTEHLYQNSATKDRRIRLMFDLPGSTDWKSQNGATTCRISGGYPQSIIPQLFGAVSATHPLSFSDGKFAVELTVPAGKTVSCVIVLAISPNETKAQQASQPAENSRGESTRYWNHQLTEEIPAFTCSDPYLEKLYYFRWWSLMNKMNVGGYGHWTKPLAREGTVAFNALISYSGAPSTIDLRWMRSPDWAYGNIQSFYENLHDGKLANHIYPDSLDGDKANNAPGLDGKSVDFPYQNFLVKALADVYALHPDKALLRQLWPALQQAAGLYDRELDADHDGLFETYPWSNITGQEWGARALYFHPYDHLLGYERTWSPKDDHEAANVADMIEKSVVLPPGTRIPRTAREMLPQVDGDRHYRQESIDENCYAYADLTAMADIARVLDEKSAEKKWRAEANKTRSLVLQKLWDPATAFFYDRDGATKQWSLVKSPTGFYPFWAGIAGKKHLPLFHHLFNTNEFWTPFPLPSISLDYPTRTELRRVGWDYWNWPNWPMTTSHVVDAAARAAKDLDPTLVSGAAELLRRYTMVHFIKGDLKHPCISEHFDPLTGQANAATLDYAHSYYIDLILRHVVGVEADPLSNEILIHPLNLGLDHFEARNIWVKGHQLTVSWKPGRYIVSVDGKPAISATHLKPLRLQLKPVGQAKETATLQRK